jgi:hypothetical protein
MGEVQLSMRFVVLFLVAIPSASAALRVAPVRVPQAARIKTAVLPITKSLAPLSLTSIPELPKATLTGSVSPILAGGLTGVARDSARMQNVLPTEIVANAVAFHQPTTPKAQSRHPVAKKVAAMSRGLVQAKKQGTLSLQLSQLYHGQQGASEADPVIFEPSPGRDRITLPRWAAMQYQDQPRVVPAPSGNKGILRVGESVIDSNAPGAAEVLDSFATLGGGAMVFGMFDTRDVVVVNSFAWGRGGVLEHKHALPPNADRTRIGGYTFMMQADGVVHWRESGSVRQPLTPSVKRAILRHLGVRPAELSYRQRFMRGLQLIWDRAIVFALQGFASSQHY